MTPPEAATLMLAMRQQLYALKGDRLGGSDYGRGVVSALITAACDSLIAAAFVIDRNATRVATEQP